MKYFKRYVICYFIALIFFGGLDGYRRPGEDMRVGGAVVEAAIWPVVVAVAVGNTLGEVMREMRTGKVG